MSEHDKGQVAASAAEIYEQFFVPALFHEWPGRVLEIAQVGSGHQVLDVACGTGVLARSAASVVGDTGGVVGLDINDGMLAVAKSKSSSVVWQHGAAESLPFENETFDRVVSQFGLMFFPDQVKAIAEMLRVLKSDGVACVAVWGSLAGTPGYLAVAEMLRELFGPEVAQSIEAPYSLGDTEQLQQLFVDAGAANIDVQTVSGTARFESLESWLYTDIKGWTLADVIDDAGYERLTQAAPEFLSAFVGADGRVAFDAPAHLVRFTKS